MSATISRRTLLALAGGTLALTDSAAFGATRKPGSLQYSAMYVS